MRYTQPQILATYPAAATIQQIHNFGVKPPSTSTDASMNACTSSGYDADE